MTVATAMGQTTAGAQATLDLVELLATRLLVQGNSGSRKSHLLRRLLEQSAPWVHQTIIDPEGDFSTLAERFGHLVIDAEAHTELAGEHARIHRASTILNLEGRAAEDQLRRAAAFLDGTFDIQAFGAVLACQGAYILGTSMEGGLMRVELSRDEKPENRAKPSVTTKRVTEAAAKMLRDARSSRMAAALSSANRKTGLFKK